MKTVKPPLSPRTHTNTVWDMKKGINDDRLRNNFSNLKDSAICIYHLQTSAAGYFVYRLSRSFCKKIVPLLLLFALDYV